MLDIRFAGWSDTASAHLLDGSLTQAWREGRFWARFDSGSLSGLTSEALKVTGTWGERAGVQNRNLRKTGG